MPLSDYVGRVGSPPEPGSPRLSAQISDPQSGPRERTSHRRSGGRRRGLGERLHPLSVNPVASLSSWQPPTSYPPCSFAFSRTSDEKSHTACCLSTAYVRRCGLFLSRGAHDSIVRMDRTVLIAHACQVVSRTCRMRVRFTGEGACFRFSWADTQERGRWTACEVWVSVREKLPICLPKRRRRSTLPPATEDTFPTSLPCQHSILSMF